MKKGKYNKRTIFKADRWKKRHGIVQFRLRTLISGKTFYGTAEYYR